MYNTDFIVTEQVILFTDLHDFSIVVKTLEQHESLNFLQEMYELFGDIVVAHQGEILKYMGDAMLCVFAAGEEIQAVQCALELRKTYFEMIKRRKISHKTELEVGISSGDVEIGIIGHKTLRQRDVFGDTVNQAAVIGHHRGIAVTGRVHERVKEQYKTHRLPDMPVKWQPDPLRLWEILKSEGQTFLSDYLTQ